jgi:peptidoglycan/LPS O-acetylase OafA/YrhL
MKYRSEIDGLRAIAVIPVILFHAGFESFSGGFIGVDVFFVISGYLITTIIHNEIQSNSFSIVNFYERRVRRILPALFFITLVCIPFSWLWLIPSDFKDFSQSIVAVNLFSSNILFWRESGYFSAAADLKPLLHTWSLAVEEQFYLFFPLILLLFRKFRDSSLLVLLITISLLSLGVSEYAAKYHPNANFYLLPTRSWELGVGAILAISSSLWSAKKGFTAEILSCIGLIMVFFSIFLFDETVLMPSSIGLIPVIGTALIIAYSNSGNIVGKLLGWKPMVGIGLISYSAYLWHQPLFAFSRIRSTEELTPSIYIMLSFFSLLLAYLTWRYVEAPFRSKKKYSRLQIFSGATVISTLFIGFGLFGHFTSGIPDRLPSEVIAIEAYSHEKPSRRESCLSDPSKYLNPPQEACIYNPGFSMNTAIWGDSHSEAIVDALSLSLLNKKEGIIQLNYSACPPVIGYRRSDKADQCNRFNIDAMKYITESKIQTVILVARWTLYLEGERFNNLEGGVESGGNVYGLPIMEDNSFIYSKNRIHEVGKLYRLTIESLLQAGIRVALIYPIPEVGWNVPKILAKKTLFNSSEKNNITTGYNVFKARSYNAYVQLDMLDEHPNLMRIHPESIFCNSVVMGRCIASLENRPLYSDDDHLNSIGSDMLSKVIVDHMVVKGWLK